jgi:hypothetical protein
LLEEVLCERWVGVGDYESGGWKVTDINVLLGEVLCERWVGDREVGVDESGGRESVEILVG